MAGNLKGVPSAVVPWARSIESRIKAAERFLTTLGYNASRVPDTDKSVYAEFTSGQNINVGTNGRVEPTTAVTARYISSTGLFEVTVSLSGLVRDGGILGVGFEGENSPYSVQYDIPKYGVVSQAPRGDTNWTPFGMSHTTTVAARPGQQDLRLYLYCNNTAGDYSAAYVKRCSLSVKAV